MATNIPVNKNNPSIKPTDQPLGKNAQIGTANKDALTKKAPASMGYNVFDYTDYFNPDAGIYGGFRGFTDKKGY